MLQLERVVANVDSPMITSVIVQQMAVRLIDFGTTLKTTYALDISTIDTNMYIDSEVKLRVHNKFDQVNKDLTAHRSCSECSKRVEGVLESTCKHLDCGLEHMVNIHIDLIAFRNTCHANQTGICTGIVQSVQFGHNMFHCSSIDFENTAKEEPSQGNEES
jgi:hypothetical protein